MSYKTWVDPEILYGDDINEHLMSQVVARFASAGARNTAIPSPEEGHLVHVTGTGYMTYNGTTWEPLISTALKPGTSVARLNRSILTAVADSTVVPLDNENWDTLGGHSGTNPSRYTAQVAGKYNVHGVLQHRLHTPGTCIAHVAVNGSTYSTVTVAQSGSVAAGTAIPYSDTVSLGIGDYVELKVENSSNAATPVNGSFMNVVFLG